MAAPAIEVRGLRKTYGAVEAVRGIDLCVYRGEVFALLGPNGAGKTTTVEILEGHRDRTAGEVSVLGCDPGLNDRAPQTADRHSAPVDGRGAVPDGRGDDRPLPGILPPPPAAR